MELAVDQRFQTMREMIASLKQPSDIPESPTQFFQPGTVVISQPIVQTQSATSLLKPAFQLTKPRLAVLIAGFGCLAILSIFGVKLLSKSSDRSIAGLVTSTNTIDTARVNQSITPSATNKPDATLTPGRKTFSKTLKIRGDQDWQNTGASVNSGDRFAIIYDSGEWSPWEGGSCDGNGMPDTDPVINNIVTGVLHASLIGRIGSQDPFFIGNSFSHIVDQTGNIYLRINDTVLEDNSGEITISIEVTHNLGVNSSNVEIYANKGWQSTGVVIDNGAELTIEVTGGKWTNCKGCSPYNSGEGSEYICGNFTDTCVEPLPKFPSDGLIGRIGDFVFGIGQGVTIIAPQSGELELRINDGDDGLLDNDGSLMIRILL